MPVIPALKMVGQDDCLELEASLGHKDIVRSYLKRWLSG